MWIVTEDKRAVNTDALLEVCVSSCGILYRPVIDDGRCAHILGTYATKTETQKVFGSIMDEIAAGTMLFVMPKSDYTEPEKSFAGVPRGLFDEGQI